MAASPSLNSFAFPQIMRKNSGEEGFGIDVSRMTLFLRLLDEEWSDALFGVEVGCGSGISESMLFVLID